MNALGSTVNLVHTSPRLRIGQCVVDLGTHRILHGERITRLAPKSVAVLRCLLAHAGQTVSRDQLIEEVWNSLHASDELLTQAIKELRRAFHDDPKTPHYIETIPKDGYRLIAAVTEEGLEPLAVGHVVDLLPAASNEVKTDVAPDREPSAERPPPGRSPGTYLIAACAVLLATIALLVFSKWPEVHDGRKIDLQTHSITSGYDMVEFPSMSPDGTLVAYSAQIPSEPDVHLYIQTIDGSPPLPMERISGASDTYPVWSPNGTSIAFLRMEEHGCTIRIVAATGGASRPVASCYKDTLSYFDWSPDSQFLVTQAEAENKAVGHEVLKTVRISDGRQSELAYARDVHSDDVNPHYSPDGRRIAFRRGANPFSDIFVMNTDGGNLHRLTNISATISGFAWTSDSRSIIFSSKYQSNWRLLWLNVENGAVTPTDLDDTAFPSVSAKSSELTAVRDRSVVNLAEYALDGTQHSVKHLSSRSPSSAHDSWPVYAMKSNDLCFVSDRSGSSQVWLNSADGKQSTMLSDFRQNETLSNPAWAADGERVLVIAQSQRRSRLFSIDISSHQVNEVITSDENIRAAHYAPDGESLDIVSDRSGSWQLWRYHPDSGKYALLLDAPVIAFGHGPNDEIYFTLASGPGLYRSNGQGRQMVSEEIDDSDRLAWQVSRSGIFFVKFEPDRTAALRLLRWSDTTSTIFSTVENFGAETPIAVSPDESRMTVPAWQHSASAIIVSRLPDDSH